MLLGAHLLTVAYKGKFSALAKPLHSKATPQESQAVCGISRLASHLASPSRSGRVTSEST